jgi:short-subunit dehydrogenase
LALLAHGRVDGLVTVAGCRQPSVPFTDLDYPQMEEVLAVNLWGVVHTCKAFLPHLVARRAACIVNVSSMGALAPVPGQSMYGASKAAVKLFTEGLYTELRDTGVAVTVVFPGGADTDGAPEAARQIVQGIEKGSYRVVIGKDARGLDRLSRFSPQRASDLFAKRMSSPLAT